MNNLIVIGAGQIGSRHLQALSLLDNKHRIWVVDPCQSALMLAEKRSLEVAEESQRVSYVTEIPTGQKFDLAVIATGAAERFTVFKQLLSENQLSNVIFEKVLFQASSDIRECAALLKKNNIRAWVNCPRRGYDSYIKLKERMHVSGIDTMRVIGANFGLGCNGIHFIDLFAFIHNEPILSVKHELKNDIVEAKRIGCYEVFGQLEVMTRNGSLHLTCENDISDIVFKVEFISDQRRFEVDEIGQQLCVYNLQGELLEQSPFPIPLQSLLTHHIASDILSTGICSLPSYTESALHHEHFISALSEHFQAVYPNRFESCPIS